MFSVMRLTLLALVIGLHITLSFGAPLILPDALQQGLQRLTAPVYVGRSLDERQNNKGGKGQAAQQKAVQNAANSFAGDVATVSSSLNGLGTTTDKNKIKQLATAGYNAELDEDQHRAVLFQAAGSSAKAANQKIVDNTPIVLKGLQSIMQNPTQANTAKQLNTIETARNAQILPSITQLSNSAFQATGVQATAQKFASTSGAQKAKQLQASTKATAGKSN